jgi:hypothetical protein
VRRVSSVQSWKALGSSTFSSDAEEHEDTTPLTTEVTIASRRRHRRTTGDRFRIRSSTSAKSLMFVSRASRHGISFHNARVRPAG